MKITEIIAQTLHEDSPLADGKKLAPDQFSGIKGLKSLPALSMNKSNGSFYQQYRFGLALAGAPEIPTPAAGALSGDPVMTTYTQAEQDMIDFAFKQLGLDPHGGDPASQRNLTDDDSKESPDVNRRSTHRQVGAIQRKTK
jgi:hypothetical protein